MPLVWKFLYALCHVQCRYWILKDSQAKIVSEGLEKTKLKADMRKEKEKKIKRLEAMSNAAVKVEESPTIFSE